MNFHRMTAIIFSKINNRLSPKYTSFLCQNSEITAAGCTQRKNKNFADFIRQTSLMAMENYTETITDVFVQDDTRRWAQKCTPFFKQLTIRVEK